MAAAARSVAADNGAGPAAPAGDAPAMTPVVKSEWDKTPRNAPCPCGSGKKFKLCHGKA
jgi:preprotein translocase subunit SecA